MSTATNDIITTFGELSPNTLVTIQGLAKIFNVCPRTIMRMESRGEIPPGVGKPKRWLIGDIIAWISERARKKAEEMKKYFR